MSQQIPRLDSNTSYQYFFNEFLVQNKVCIFDQSLTQLWRSRKEWLTSDGRPDLDQLSRLFGKALVPISDCNTKYYNSNPKEEMFFNDFIDYLKKVQKIGYNYNENDLKVLYLKDWHFVQQFPDYKAYETPVYFESDWVNEYFIKNSDLNDDYRFVYFGPKQSSTPLHVDVFGSFSWSANICGVKKWLIIPPGNEDRLKALNNNQMPHNFYLFSNYTEKLKSMNGLEIIQKEGEIIFIPSGYIHQVLNIEDTISVNHNWFNGTNIQIIFNNILNAFNEVERELSDLKQTIDSKEWYKECQTLLKIHFGFNFNDFFDCLQTISERIKCESNDKHLKEMLFRFHFDTNSLKSLLCFVKSIHFLDFRNEIIKIENNINF